MTIKLWIGIILQRAHFWKAQKLYFYKNLLVEIILERSRGKEFTWPGEILLHVDECSVGEIRWDAESFKAWKNQTKRKHNIYKVNEKLWRKIENRILNKRNKKSIKIQIKKMWELFIQSSFVTSRVKLSTSKIPFFSRREILNRNSDTNAENIILT